MKNGNIAVEVPVIGYGFSIIKVKTIRFAFQRIHCYIPKHLVLIVLKSINGYKITVVPVIKIEEKLLVQRIIQVEIITEMRN